MVKKRGEEFNAENAKITQRCKEERKDGKRKKERETPFHSASSSLLDTTQPNA